MKLELTDRELAKVKNWMKEHDKTCFFTDPMECGASGGRFTYEFTHTNIAAITRIRCVCGSIFDFTDYGDW
jgi:hypothetical protein